MRASFREQKFRCLSSVLSYSNELLNNVNKIITSANVALGKIHSASIKAETADDVVKMYNQLMSTQESCLSILNKIVERFPIELDLQEIELLDNYRALASNSKSTMFTAIRLLRDKEEAQ
jgi:hypothetical protein